MARAHGLSINQSLNGNAAPVEPGRGREAAPDITATAGNTVGVLANTASGNLTGIEIRGLTLSTSGRDLERDRRDVGERGERRRDDQQRHGHRRDGGRDRHQPGQHSAQATVSLTNVTVTSTGNGHRYQRDGRHADGDRLQRICTSPATRRSGIVVTNATFDATAGGAYNQVGGGTSAVGDSGNPVGGAGVVLTNVSGDLAFTISTSSRPTAPALQVTGTGALNAGAGTGTRVPSPPRAATSAVDRRSGGEHHQRDRQSPARLGDRHQQPTTGISLVNVATAQPPPRSRRRLDRLRNTTGRRCQRRRRHRVDELRRQHHADEQRRDGVGQRAGTPTRPITFSGDVERDQRHRPAVRQRRRHLQLHRHDDAERRRRRHRHPQRVGRHVQPSARARRSPTRPARPSSCRAAMPTSPTAAASRDNSGFAVDIDNHDAGTVTFQTGIDHRRPAPGCASPTATAARSTSTARRSRSRPATNTGGHSRYRQCGWHDQLRPRRRQRPRHLDDDRHRVLGTGRRHDLGDRNGQHHRVDHRRGARRRTRPSAPAASPSRRPRRAAASAASG